MIKAKLYFKDYSNWYHDGNGSDYKSDHGWLLINKHSALTSYTFCNFGIRFIVVTEKSSFDIKSIDQQIAFLSNESRVFEKLRQALEETRVFYIVFCFDKNSNFPIKILTGFLPYPAVFIRCFDDYLSISSSILDLFKKDEVIIVDKRRLASRLLLRNEKAKDLNFINQTIRLSSGICFEFSSSGYREEKKIMYNKFPRKNIKASIDVHAHLNELVSRFFLRRKLINESVSVEISGGLDSAVLGISAAASIGPVQACGVEVIGDHNIDQIYRRKCVIEKMKSADSVIRINEYLPSFDQNTRRFNGILRDIYHPSFHTEYESQVKNGMQWLVSGLGGDEAFPIFNNEVDTRGKNFLKPLVLDYHTEYTVAEAGYYENFHEKDYSAVISIFPTVADQGNMVLEHGLWLLCPYTDPEIIQFCASLPVAYRNEKDILRGILKRAGLSIFQEYESESFHDAMISSVNSMLADQENYCSVKILSRLGMVENNNFKIESKAIKKILAAECHLDSITRRRIDYFASVIHIERYLIKLSETNEVR